MTRVEALMQLGLAGQDFGPCFADEWTHEEFAAGWRGTSPCPTEEEIEAAKLAYQPVPQEVPRRQGLQALHLRGYLAQVPGIIAAIPDPVQRALAQIEFDESLYFERQRPMVLYVGAQLELNAAALDELFIFASTL